MSENNSSEGEKKTSRYEKTLEVTVKGKSNSEENESENPGNGDDDGSDDDSDNGSGGSGKPDRPTESDLISYTHEDAACPEPNTVEITGKMEFDESLFATEVKLIREEVDGNEDIQVDTMKDVWQNEDVTETEIRFKAGNQPEGMIDYRLEFYAIELNL